MNLPKFTAEISVSHKEMLNYINKANRNEHSTPMITAAAGKEQFPAEFGPTLTCNKVCRSVPIYRECGSAPEGEVPPMCPTGETTEECWYECDPVVVIL